MSKCIISVRLYGKWDEFTTVGIYGGKNERPLPLNDGVVKDKGEL